jgi:acylphosphatase
MMKTMHVRITGLVQGVGFRYFVLRQASTLGVRGWVRNTVDGGVEVIGQGDESTLHRLLSHLRQGPSRAHVRDATIEWLNTDDLFHTFELR